MATPNSSDVAALRAEVERLVISGDLATLRMIEDELSAAVARREREDARAREAAAYGRLAKSNPWARVYEGEQDGEAVMTLLTLDEHDAGCVAYQLPGLRAEDLT